MASSNRALTLVVVGSLLLLPVVRAENLLVGINGKQPVAGRAGGHNAPAQGYLGIMFHDVSDSTVSSQHLKDKRGAEIVMVDHDGPAGKAGLREHDVVLSMNGVAIENQEQLRKMLHEMQPGRMITLSVCRDGAERTLNATMSTREEVDRQARLQRWSVPAPTDDVAAAAPAPAPAPPKSSGGVFGHSFMPSHLLPLLPVYTGATVDVMGPQLADYFGVKDGNGLLVHSVEGNSPAASAGLHAGDVVTRMNGNRIATEKDWTRNLHDSKGRVIMLTIVRARHEQTLTMIADGPKRSAVELPAELGVYAGPMLMFR